MVFHFQEVDVIIDEDAIEVRSNAPDEEMKSGCVVPLTEVMVKREVRQMLYEVFQTVSDVLVEGGKYDD